MEKFFDKAGFQPLSGFMAADELVDLAFDKDSPLEVEVNMKPGKWEITMRIEGEFSG